MRDKNIEEVFAYHSETMELLHSTGNDSTMIVPLPEFVEEHLAYHPGQRDEVTSAHKEWLSVVRDWINDPTSPSLSYHFLDGHPAFWTLAAVEDGGDPVFKTGGFAARFWKALGRKGDEVVYMMECGGAVPPRRDHHYHDIDLDAYSSSWDECFVDTARYTFTVFTITGVAADENREFIYPDEDDNEDEESD